MVVMVVISHLREYMELSENTIRSYMKNQFSRIDCESAISTSNVRDSGKLILSSVVCVLACV
jgi:hypothetical protein